MRCDKWIVIGGGASGIATSFFLKQRGIDSEIIEGQSAIGGRMGSVKLGNRLLDCGGKNIGRGYALFRQFAAALGAHPFEHFGLNSSQARNGRLVTFDGQRRWRSLLDLACGMSPFDMARFARMLRRVKSAEENGYLGSSYFSSMEERHDHRPVSEYFGREFCRRIIRPMSVRMNGAEPDEIHLGNLGSNLRMVMDTYDQLRDGLAPLLRDFEDGNSVRLNTRCESLVLRNGRVAGVRVRNDRGASEELACSGVVLATPAPVSAGLVQPILPDLARRLRSVAYYPVMLVLAEYRRPIFCSRVRAVVFDEEEPLSNAGAYGLNDLHVVRYTFSGRTARRCFAESVGDEDLLRMGEGALNRYIRVSERERENFAVRRFDLGLCAYTPSHSNFLDAVGRELRKASGLYVTGDYIQGASIEACFRSAKACVRQLAVAERERKRCAGPEAAIVSHAERRDGR